MNLGHVDFKARINPNLWGIVVPQAKGIVSRNAITMKLLGWS